MTAINAIHQTTFLNQNLYDSHDPKRISLCERLENVTSRFFHSPTIRILKICACIAINVTILIFSQITMVTVLAAIILGVALISLGMQIIFNGRKIFCEISIFGLLVINALKPRIYSWWHDIAPHLILGAIPLKNFAHDEQLVNKWGIRALLSVIEDYEFHTQGIFSKPCKKQDWLALKIEHKILPMVEFKVIPLKVLEEGVAFLEKNINKGINCYIHCKAGVSRSATIALAYLLKKKIVPSVNEGINYLKQKRRIISISKAKKNVLELFYQKHCVNPT